MLSHLAFVCAMEGRSCPLYSLGCTKVHSFEDAEAMSHIKLLMQARVSGACNVSDHFNNRDQKAVFFQNPLFRAFWTKHPDLPPPSPRLQTHTHFNIS